VEGLLCTVPAACNDYLKAIIITTGAYTLQSPQGVIKYSQLNPCTSFLDRFWTDLFLLGESAQQTRLLLEESTHRSKENTSSFRTVCGRCGIKPRV